MGLVGWIVMMALVGFVLALATRTDCQPARRVRVIVSGRDSSIVAVVAGRWANQRVGLLNHAMLPATAGLVIEGATRVHGEGMLFPFDVVFLDVKGCVTAIYADLQPGAKSVAGPKGTAKALELASGVAAAVGMEIGETILFESAQG